jgi:hypothetical protein
MSERQNAHNFAGEASEAAHEVARDLRRNGRGPDRQLIQPNCLDALVPRLKLRQPGSA